MSLETPARIRTLQRALYTKAKEEPAYRFYLLYDKVYRADILTHAYACSRAARGAPGVDGVTFATIEATGVEAFLAGLQEELKTHTYRPQPVRRVLIPKDGGGTRPLGIPTIRDRVVQTAVKLVVEPIFEADFDADAYGYRPGRSAHDAVEAVHQTLRAGYTDVVDADLSKYFDTIPHDALLQSLARRIVDRHVLTLLKAWLKVPVEEEDEQGRRRWTGGKRAQAGTPQGGVISPLLANIYMHRLLRAWRARGKPAQYRARLINYADDFVILSRGHAAEALAWVTWAVGQLGLTLNPTKTCLRDAQQESFTFLGYTFGPVYSPQGDRYLGAAPARKAVQRVKRRIAGVLTPSNTAPWPTVVTEVNQVLRGWAAYFSYGTRWASYRALDQYVEDRVRHFLRRRHKVATRATRRFNRATLYDRLGVVRLRARLTV